MTAPKGASQAAGGASRRRLFVFNGGFLTQRRLRRILDLAGWDVRLGLPAKGETIGVWGRSPTAHRGEHVAARRGAALLRVEDAFLRSVRPGRAGDPPLGLMLDPGGGVHFDHSHPSALETLLKTHPLDDTALLQRSRDGIARMKASELSKYNNFDLQAPLPEAPYVLVVDQTRGDASIRWSGATPDSFGEALALAREENPGARIVVKTHPETQAGHRPGHFGPETAALPGVTLLTAPASPWRLLEGATAVYAVSSQLGFEAILAGHRPVILGAPFYAGWGLTDDRAPVLRRRGRPLTRAQIFAAAMILHPLWYDPHRDRLCDFETALDMLEAQTRAYREDWHGYAAYGMRAWKRAPLQRFLGRERPVRFAAKEPGDRIPVVWANRAAEAPPGALRMEDGFLRSRGLGAALTPPLSLVLDDLGIYYDPRSESRLERLIAAAPSLPDAALRRAERLRARLIAARVTKYNLGGALPDLPPRPGARRILVPGQVEDDASILTGAGEVRTNLALLAAARAANPGAVILYKPHPDVEAGLRLGAIPEDETARLADAVLSRADPLALIDAVDEVWTMTSLLGFEALIRGRAVTTLGAPFYAGWGLTRDLGPSPARRSARPGLDGLVHAALIAYPRYHDRVTGLPCPPEVAVDRLADPATPAGGPALRTLAKLQGRLAGYAWLWRR